MNRIRMMAIVEREMRKFFRSPALMLVSMIFPLVQLIVLGNAFGGKIRDAKLAVVDEDGGTQALKIREAFDSVRANIRTFVPVYYDNEKQAMEDVRNGKLEGAVIIPPNTRGASTSRTIRASRWSSTTATTS
jgi:ABC-2 type transport system permease protein